MIEVIAFDSKDFKRTKTVGDEVGGQQIRQLVFHSPLGVGIAFKDRDQASRAIMEETKRLLPKFDIDSSLSLIYGAKFAHKFGFPRTLKLCDELLQSVQDKITKVFVRHVVLPPKSYPYVEVGGVRCPRQQIRTELFLRQLSPTFSHIAAWHYFGKPGESQRIAYLDGFSSKQTPAWEELSHKKPIIYMRGDLCNPLISLADAFAFLTDRKLYGEKLPLRAENVESVWKDYGFEVDAKYLDHGITSKIAWHINNQIDLSPYLAHPIVFFMADGYNAESIEEMPIFQLAASLALQEGGCIQGYDKNIDSQKVRNGDIVVYAGERSLKDTKTLQDMYDVETLSFKELSQRLKT